MGDLLSASAISYYSNAKVIKEWKHNSRRQYRKPISIPFFDLAGI